MGVAQHHLGIMTATVDDEHRIVLSEELRRRIGLAPGDSFQVELGFDAIVLRPCLDEDDEDPALFWGPNWREELEEAFADEAAGRTTRYWSDEEFLASLESRIRANT
jgi:bifunctional DNA-binding transcriptional regulator/antitoxin component of YhaV-PrlF toxin-antitoxin module